MSKIYGIDASRAHLSLAGCGKSILLSVYQTSLIDHELTLHIRSWAAEATQRHCQKDTTSSCAFFYCDFQDSSTHKAANILGSIAAQFAEQDFALLQTFQSLYDEEKHLTQRSPVKIVDLERILGQSLATGSTKYILLDAVNELPDQTELLECLSRLMGILTTLRCFVTSTADLASSFIDTSILETIQVGPGDTIADISTLLEHTLQTDPKLRRLGVSLQEEIRKTLLESSDGS